MSFEKAKADLEVKGLGDNIIVLNESSATVAEAAHALGVEPASIAKTLSVLQGEKPVLIVTEGVEIYLDESLRKFETVYPAAGNGHTAVKLSLAQLEAAAGAKGWVDVCKEPEE